MSKNRGLLGILSPIKWGALRLRKVGKVNLGLLFTLALTLMITTAYLSYRSYERTLTSYTWVSHTQEVLAKISYGQATLYETESEVRSYIIFQQAKYKPDIVTSERQIDSVLVSLKNLTTDNKIQQKNIEEVRPMVRERFKVWEGLINNIFSLSLYEQDSMILTGIGITQKINRQMDEMKNIETTLLNKRSVNTSSDVSSSPLFLLAASLLSIIIVAALFIQLNRSFKESEQLRLDVLKKNAELSRSNQDLEQFAYVASHDLQEPLRKMRSFAERLKFKEQDHLTPEGLDIVGKLEGFATKMQQLIDDLLLFSRVVNSKIEGKKVDLNEALAEAKNNLADSISKKKAKIYVERLPVIVGYESQMVQLFQNLLSNSIKYSKADVPPVINVSAGEVDSSAIKSLRNGDEGKKFYKIQFSDNGIGFNEQYAEKIFIVFQRLHGKGEYEGTGIGLAISKAVVMNHNGYILAEGQEQKGAIFTIYLPITNPS
jgi:signal transduction histidine kinase